MSAGTDVKGMRWSYGKILEAGYEASPHIVLTETISSPGPSVSACRGIFRR